MIRNPGPMTERMRSRTSTGARSCRREGSARGVRRQPRRLDPRNAGFPGLLTRSAARSSGADDLAFLVPDQDAARLRQEFSLGGRGERHEEIGIVLGAFEKGA